MRRRRSSRSSSGTSTRKGRTAGWVSIGCTPHPVERRGVISPAVLHNEVKCEVLEGLAQLPRTPLWRSSRKASSTKFGEGRTLKPLVVCTEPHLYLQDRSIVGLLHYFEAHLIQLLCRVVMFAPSVGFHRYPVQPVDARGVIRGDLR